MFQAIFQIMNMMNILKRSEYGRAILLLKKLMGVREDIRENPAVNVIFSLQRIGIKNRARTQMTLVYTQCIFVVQISKMIFSCFSTIFTSKIHIYKTKNFLFSVILE